MAHLLNRFKKVAIGLNSDGVELLQVVLTPVSFTRCSDVFLTEHEFVRYLMKLNSHSTPETSV